MIENKKILLMNGQIISSKSNKKSAIVNFQQLIINLDNLKTMIIKKPKIQETSTFILMKCLISENENLKFCNNDFKKEIISTLNRRIVIPFYIPLIALICALSLIKTKSIYLNKYFSFFYSFILIVFTELAVRYTGINSLVLYTFFNFTYFIIFICIFFLIYKFSGELKHE